MTDTSTTTSPSPEGGTTPVAFVRELIGRITRLEVITAAVVAAAMLLLVIIEPEILEAPFENTQTLLFTVGGTALAAAALVALLWFRVPAPARLVVLGVPFVIVNWWLLSPYFIDDVVDEGFSTSISAQSSATDQAPANPAASPEEVDSSTDTASPGAESPLPASPSPPAADDPADPTPTTEPVGDGSPGPEAPAGEEPATPPPPAGPVLLGAGQFVGLAGHSGTGDAGIFRNPDGTLVLRFENFDIQNGPDLEVYLVPGADQTSLPEGSIHLGALKGNVGDQNYELPADVDLLPGAYTALVWCEAFSVEFVGATITI